LKIRAKQKLDGLKKHLIDTIVFHEDFLQRYNCWTENCPIPVEVQQKLDVLELEHFSQRKITKVSDISKISGFDLSKLSNLTEYNLYLEINNKMEQFQYLYYLFDDYIVESGIVFLSGLLFNSLKELLDCLERCQF